MQYEVMITADGVPVDQLSAAAANFRLVMESKLGGTAQVRPCFLASAKLTREGGSSLFPQEAIDARAWTSAFSEAEAAVKRALDRQDVGIMVKLGLPVH
ncbi:hypothetical protein ACCC97_10245 [Variovorax sp. Varisp85]|uniref:hypothetical protein n=1 Tax=Variovorax sp. Varisp85 TaxID=3243059 RepID=UPI0039A6DCF7